MLGVAVLLCTMIVFVYKHDISHCCFSVSIFFLIMGAISIYSITKNGGNSTKNGKNDRKRLNKYMIIRTAKIFVAAIFFLIYWLVVDPEDMTGFAMTFAIFYLAYLVFETWSFFQVEKKIKNNVQ